MTEAEYNEWVDIEVDVPGSEPQQTTGNEEENTSDGSEDEHQEESESRKKTTKALSILRRALEQSGIPDKEYNAL